MMKFNYSLLLCLFLIQSGFSKTPGVIVANDIELPANASHLINDLNSFLEAVDGPPIENNRVKSDQKTETYLLLDELAFLHRNELIHQDHYYSIYLESILEIEEKQWMLQLSYIGKANDTIELRALIELMAFEEEDGFYFASPLLHHRQNFQSYSESDIRFYFKQNVVQNHLEEHVRYTRQFDEKLGIEAIKTDYYLCDRFSDALELIGVLYKRDYKGMRRNALAHSSWGKKILILGLEDPRYEKFDEHDLWHSRLSLKEDRRKIHKPLDEGCAYLYAGSWGMGWKEIFDRFLKEVASDSNANWMDYKEYPYDFGKNAQTHLYADYVVNALLAEHIESLHGFEGVMRLLKSGPYQSGNDTYYQILEELTGISKENYNDQVWSLIRSQEQKLSKK